MKFAFLIHYLSDETRSLMQLDGGGRATSRGTVEAFAKRGLGEVPYRGVLPGTLTVPGAVASWKDQFGR